MAKLKATKDITTLGGVLKSGSVINDLSPETDKISFKENTGATISISRREFTPSFESVEESTPENVMFQKTQVVEDIEAGVQKFGKSMRAGSTIGLLAGLGIAYYRKGGVGSYIGYGLGLGILGAILGGYFGGKKALKETTNKLLK